MTVSIADLPQARQPDLVALLGEVYGEAVSEEELDWLFDRNPAGARVLSGADENGRLAGALGMTFARGLVGPAERLVAFSVHAVTRPAARGQGIFSRLELRNEKLAAQQGAAFALGFTNRQAGPILVGKLGWRDIHRMRIWARPLRPLRALRRRGGGGLRPARNASIERFTEAQERDWRAVQPQWGSGLVRDTAYLNWRYLDAPRDYRALACDEGYAVVGHAVQKGISTAVICDLVGPPRPQRRLLLRCLDEARGGADLAIGVPAPDQRRAFLSAGFLPSPRTIRVIGKQLGPEALPDGRWHFSLGDTDFF